MAENPTSKAELIEKFKAEIEAQVAAANNAISSSNVPALNEATVKLKEAEEDYMELKAKIVYDELLTKEHPAVEAAKQLMFSTYKHREVRREGKLIAFEITEGERQIDMLKFCEYGKLDTTWQYTVQKFNQLLCLRVSEGLGLSAPEIKRICDSYYLAEQAKNMDLGETPASKRALLRLLQQVIDGIMYVDDGDGKNVYKCNQYDVNYMLDCYTKRGKKALSVACAKHEFLRRTIMTVCHRIICNGRYAPEFPGDKNFSL